MSKADIRTATVIPIQDTFDIAQGRNTVRTTITLLRWPLSFNARAATALTALGEIILLHDRSKVITVHMAFVNDQPKRGMELRCTLPNSVQEIKDWKLKTENLARAADTVDIQEGQDKLEIRVSVWL